MAKDHGGPAPKGDNGKYVAKCKSADCDYATKPQPTAGAAYKAMGSHATRRNREDR